MPMNERRSTYVTILLLVILAGIIGESGYILTRYYMSSDYIAEKYIKGLAEKDYKTIYKVLDKASVRDVGGEAEVAAYYKKRYEQQQKLMDVKLIAAREHTYKLQYVYKDKQENGIIQLVKKGSRWQVRFPFDFHTIQVFGPNGCKVFIDDKQLVNSENGRYISSYILPGRYLLQVSFPHEGYKDYYQMVTIPKENTLILPYDTVSMKVYTAPGLKIRADQFEKTSSGSGALFGELLPGSYTISVEDPDGVIETQQKEITVDQQEHSCHMEDYKLTPAGEKKYAAFWKTFYGQYERAVKEHNAGEIRPFIDGKNRKALIDQFRQWYIDKKDIKDVTFSYECGEGTFDAQGCLHQDITETAVLYNQEKNDQDELVTKAYKIKLTWETVLRPIGKEWGIKDRWIKESIAAIQDSEGRWIQY